MWWDQDPDPSTQADPMHTAAWRVLDFDSGKKRRQVRKSPAHEVTVCTRQSHISVQHPLMPQPCVWPLTDDFRRVFFCFLTCCGARGTLWNYVVMRHPLSLQWPCFMQPQNSERGLWDIPVEPSHGCPYWVCRAWVLSKPHRLRIPHGAGWTPLFSFRKPRSRGSNPML